MTSVRQSPCAWPLDVSCCPDWATADAAARARATALAVDYLWASSGRKLGVCPVVARPCRDRCGSCGGRNALWQGWGFPGLPQGEWGSFSPWLDGGTWRNDGCGCGPVCCCEARCQQRLPGPVESVTQVKVDGLVIDPSTYRIDDYDTLTGTGRWLHMFSGFEPSTLPGLWTAGPDRPAFGTGLNGDHLDAAGCLVFTSTTPGFVNFGLRRPDETIRVCLDPFAQLVIPAGMTVVAIEPAGGPASTAFLFPFSGPPVEVRGGPSGGCVTLRGQNGQSYLLNLSLAGPDARICEVGYVRPGETQCWPECQDMDLPDTEAGTWSVSYNRGIPVPAAGQAAAGSLACELLRACGAIGGKCRLPAKTTNIVRQGLSIELNDPLDLIKDGFTGLQEVDMWIKGVNPSGLWAPSTAWSPDLTQPRRVTWP